MQAANPHFSHSWLKALGAAETDFAVNEESIFLNIGDDRNAKYGRQMHAILIRSVRNVG